jgi:hypothetical protein
LSLDANFLWRTILEVARLAEANNLHVFSPEKRWASTRAANGYEIERSIVKSFKSRGHGYAFGQFGLKQKLDIQLKNDTVLNN